jgi:predicted metal-dependent enzyme (double-stranded beta helix superfamily)
MGSFELEAFIEECRGAIAARNAHKAVHGIVAHAVSDPTAVTKTLGEPNAGGIQKLYHSPDLTILNIVWAPKMTLFPHNHRMWAVIGIYGGREDNIFWKRLPGSPEGRVEAAGAKSLHDRDAVMLGTDVIHSVTNPIPRLTGAIHVYGGDFFNAARSEWDPETLREQPCDVARLAQQFEEDNRRWFSTR